MTAASSRRAGYRAKLDQDTPDTIRMTVPEAWTLGFDALRGRRHASHPRNPTIAADTGTANTRTAVRVVRKASMPARRDYGTIGYIAACRNTEPAADKHDGLISRYLCLQHVRQKRSADIGCHPLCAGLRYANATKSCTAAPWSKH